MTGPVVLTLLLVTAVVVCAAWRHADAAATRAVCAVLGHRDTPDGACVDCGAERANPRARDGVLTLGKHRTRRSGRISGLRGRAGYESPACHSVRRVDPR